jgi:FecR protein
MKHIKLWPHVTVALIVAIAAGIGVALYLRHEQTAQAESLPNAARIQRVEGEVALNNSLNDQNENTQWIAAVPNQPFSVGDRIYTRDKSRASVAFSGRNFARLEPNTALDVIALRDDATQLALRDGSAIFDVGYLAPGQIFEVATPQGAVDFVEPGLYDIGFDNNGSAIVSVLSGLAQVVGLGGSGRISKGELLTLAGQTAAQVVLSRLNRQDAGYLVDDYYRYQYPNYYDGRYVNYDAYLNDPYYYDPYRRDISYQYVSSNIPGTSDLGYYGDWQYLNGYGYAWSPRVDTYWSPYQEGQWFNDYPYGLTWVSSEPWGYAPYHYGRWIRNGDRWFWIPDGVNTSPTYSPALVAFVPLENEVGWVPLGQGDPYVMRYYDANWQPHYLSRGDVSPARLVNLNVPGAVTVVPLDQFDRQINGRVIRRLDPQTFVQVRPTLEPLTLTPLRNAVVHSAWGRGKIDLPPGIAKKLDQTAVVIGHTTPAPSFKRDLARAMRLETVPEKIKEQKLQIRDERNNEVARGEAFRRQRIAELEAEAARGNRDARKQAQQLDQQLRKDQAEAQRQAAEQERVTREQQRQAAQQQRRQQVDAQRAAQQQEQQQQRAARGQQRQAAQQQRQQQVDAQRAAQQQAQQQQRAAREQQRQAVQQQRQAQQQQRAQGQRVGNPAKQEQRQEGKQPQAQPQGKGGKGKGKKP